MKLAGLKKTRKGESADQNHQIAVEPRGEREMMGRVRADDVFGDVGLMLCNGLDGIWVLITDISLSCTVGLSFDKINSCDIEFSSSFPSSSSSSSCYSSSCSFLLLKYGRNESSSPFPVHQWLPPWLFSFHGGFAPSVRDLTESGVLAV